MMNRKIRDYEEEELRRRAASDEELNIRLTNNYAFQKIFKNKDIVKGFLMALLHLKEKQIKDIEIIDPITSGEDNREKEGILDIKLTLNGNRKINIEMQNTYQNDWTERSLFYNCRMFTEGFRKGQKYGELPPCIHVGILDFNQMKSPGYYHKISLMDEETNEFYSGKFQFHVIELKKLGQAKGKARKQALYRWARLIAASTWEEMEIESEGNRYMERAMHEMIKMSQDEIERYLYLREEMAESDRISQLESAKDIGREEGREEGAILNLIVLVQKKIKRGDSKEKIADDLVEDINKIAPIYKAIKNNPNATKEEIYDQIREN